MPKSYQLTAKQHEETGQTVARCRTMERRGRRRRRSRLGGGGGSNGSDGVGDVIFAAVLEAPGAAGWTGDVRNRSTESASATGFALVMDFDGTALAIKEVESTYSTGTVEVTAGAVELTGGTFPSWVDLSGGSPPEISFWVDGSDDVHEVSAVTDGTNITIDDSGVTIAAGADFKIWIEQHKKKIHNASRDYVPEVGEIVVLIPVAVRLEAQEAYGSTVAWHCLSVDAWIELQKYAGYNDDYVQGLIHNGGAHQWSGLDCDENPVAES